METSVALNVDLPNSEIKEVDATSIEDSIVEAFRIKQCDITKFWLTPVDVYCYHPPTSSFARIMLLS